MNWTGLATYCTRCRRRLLSTTHCRGIDLRRGSKPKRPDPTVPSGCGPGDGQFSCQGISGFHLDLPRATGASTKTGRKSNPVLSVPSL